MKITVQEAHLVVDLLHLSRRSFDHPVQTRASEPDTVAKRKTLRLSGQEIDTNESVKLRPGGGTETDNRHDVVLPGCSGGDFRLVPEVCGVGSRTHPAYCPQRQLTLLSDAEPPRRTADEDKVPRIEHTASALHLRALGAADDRENESLMTLNRARKRDIRADAEQTGDNYTSAFRRAGGPAAHPAPFAFDVSTPQHLFIGGLQPGAADVDVAACIRALLASGAEVRVLSAAPLSIDGARVHVDPDYGSDETIDFILEFERGAARRERAGDDKPPVYLFITDGDLLDRSSHSINEDRTSWNREYASKLLRRLVHSTTPPRYHRTGATPDSRYDCGAYVAAVFEPVQHHFSGQLRRGLGDAAIVGPLAEHLQSFAASAENEDFSRRSIDVTVSGIAAGVGCIDLDGAARTSVSMWQWRDLASSSLHATVFGQRSSLQKWIDIHTTSPELLVAGIEDERADLIEEFGERALRGEAVTLILEESTRSRTESRDAVRNLAAARRAGNRHAQLFTLTRGQNVTRNWSRGREEDQHPGIEWAEIRQMIEDAQLQASWNAGKLAAERLINETPTGA